MAKGAGGVEVGRVSLRVVPNLKGFRKKLQQQANKLGDMEMAVKPDTKGIKDKIQKATKKDKPVIEADVTPKVDKRNLRKTLSDIRDTIKKQFTGQRRMIQLYTGDPKADNKQQRQRLAWLDRIKGKYKEIARARRMSDAGPSLAMAWDYKPMVSVDKINKEIAAIRKLDGVSKKLNKNRKNAQYDPRLHQDLQKLEHAAKKLRGLSGDEYSTEFRRIAKETNRIRENLGASTKDLGQFRDFFKQFSDNETRFAQPKSRRDLFKEQVMATKAAQRTKRELDRVSRAYDVVRNRISRVTAEDSRLRRGMARTGEGFRNLGNSIRRVTTNITEYSSRVRDVARGTRGISDAFSDLRRGADSTTTSTERVSKSLEKVTTSTKKVRRGFKGFNLKKMWGQFHQPENRIFGLTEMGWMATAITALIAPLSGLIGGVLGTIPAIGLAAAAAIGATVLGWEGVKTAAEAASPAVEKAKEALSGTFQDRLTPQFEALGDGLTKITPNLDKLAHGLSDFSQGFVNALTSDEGIGHIQRGIDNTAQMFSKLKPFATDFTAGLLEMASVGSESFDYLADGLNRFGSNFKESVSEMAEAGTLTGAIEGTFDVLGSIGTNLGKVMRAGMEEMPAMSEAFTSALDSLGDGIVAATPLLSRFSQSVFNIFGRIGEAVEAAVPSLTEFVDNIGPGFADALSGIGSFTGEGLSIVMDFLVALSPGMGEALSAVGDGFRGLGDALADSNLSEDATAFGTALSGLLDGVSETAPRFVEDMKSMVKAWDEATGIFSAGNAESVLEGMSAGLEGLDVYGSAVERFAKYQFDMNNAVKIASQDLRSTSTRFGDTFEEVASNIKAAAERAMEATDIDLTPQIKMIDSATTVAEINQAYIEIFEAIGAPLSEQQKKYLEIDVEPKVNVDPASAAAANEDIAAGIETDIEPKQVDVPVDPDVQLTESSNIQGKLESEVLGAIQGADMSAAADSVGQSLGDALGGIEVPTAGLVEAINASADAAGEAATGIAEAVTAALESMPEEVGNYGIEAGTGFVTGIQEQVGAAGAAAEAMASAVTSAVSGIDLSASGSAAGASFAAGIRSQVGAVRSAAAALAQAAKDPMPHSPAKMGPLSGKGYTDHSGMALAKDFAKGMLSEVRTVEAAAGRVAQGAYDGLNTRLTKPGAFEAHHRAAILDPVLEANARKIHDWRKRQEEQAEQSAERIKDIQESDADQARKEERIAKERERIAERNAESYQQMLDSLEAPDYTQINRSFESYFVQGFTDMLGDSLRDAVRNSGFASDVKGVAERSVAEARKVFGDHPIFAQVEASVNAEHFEDTLIRVIDEAGIAAMPVELVLTNLDQLKNDLGMGDGVISRALSAAYTYDPANTDQRIAEANKVEIHYHVTDLEEAMRLERERERKEMLRLG